MKINNYTIQLNENNIFDIIFEIQIDKNSNYTDFYLNSNRPGRYILFNYSASVFNFIAYENELNLSQLKFEKINKDCWRVYHNKNTDKIIVNYLFYANREDAGGNLFYKNEIFFMNPVTCLMNVNKEYENECFLTLKDINLDLNPITTLNYLGNGLYQADSYHELLDNSILISENLFTLEAIMDDGFKLNFTFYGDCKSNNYDEFINNVINIVKEQKKVFGNYPNGINSHHFIYLLTEKNIYHALEHRKCSVYYLQSKLTENNFKDLYSITSHEFFHIWNVKSLKPEIIYDFNYLGESYTNLHWLTEGFTDYYADLILYRANVIKYDDFLKEMSHIISHLENNPASEWISPSQCSYDSWLSTSEFKPFFLKTSYYTSGKRLAFLIDLKLKTYNLSLDNLFYNLYHRYYINGKGIPENAVEEELNLLTKDLYDWTEFFDNYIRGTHKINYNELLIPNNLSLTIIDAENLNNKLKNVGINKIKLIEQPTNQLIIEEIIPYSDASKTGLKHGDSIININDKEIITIEYIDNIKLDDNVNFTLSNGKKIDVLCSGKNIIKNYIIEVNKGDI